MLELEPGEVIEGANIIDEVSRETNLDFTARGGEVLILLIQTDPPGPDQVGAQLSIETKRMIGLRTSEESYVILSEFNIDVWPNAGIKRIPHSSGQFAYPEKMPGPLLSAIARKMIEFRQRRLIHGSCATHSTVKLQRHPSSMSFVRRFNELTHPVTWVTQH